MKHLCGLAALMLLFVLTGPLEADAPDLEGGVYIHDGSDPLDLEGHTAPTVVDWNNDGRKDLVVGNIKGNLWLFLNQGTDLNPLFKGGSRIESSNVPITVAYS